MTPAQPPSASKPISIQVTISLTQDQWAAYLHDYRTRSVCCEIGMDSPQVADFVMFQVFKQMNQPSGMKPADAVPSQGELPLS